ncbi:hypothetical protein PIROE2DRAFT_2532 [Piromyces sp. E2]|nr:hypothetical protein PIROE2DRAFT_2532 [Piromyces sp. E2]|eukprot:OUM69446.1 hypothetical protein PIROE2DRAFT_2532 [Piromyces sp. E2]
MSIYNATSDSLIINIINSNIELSKEISINNNLKKVSFIGDSKESSIITFNDISLGFSFYNSLQEIKFKNITLYGILRFTHINNVEFDNVILNGSFISASNSLNNDTLKFNNLIFTSVRNSKIQFCFRLYGNQKNSLSILNSYFNGKYLNGCLDVKNGDNINIKYSTFENGNSTLNGGGALRISNSKKVLIENSYFNNNYSEMDGGVFYISNVNNLLSNNIKVYNATASLNGSVLYINTESIISEVYFNDINLNIIKNINYGGLVATY